MRASHSSLTSIESHETGLQSRLSLRCEFRRLFTGSSLQHAASRLSRPQGCSRRLSVRRAATAPSEPPANNSGLSNNFGHIPFELLCKPSLSEPAGPSGRSPSCNVAGPAGAWAWREGVTDHALEASTSGAAAKAPADRSPGSSHQRPNAPHGTHRPQLHTQQPALHNNNQTPHPSARGREALGADWRAPFGNATPNHSHADVVADLSATVSRLLETSGAGLHAWLVNALHQKQSSGRSESRMLASAGPGAAPAAPFPTRGSATQSSPAAVASQRPQPVPAAVSGGGHAAAAVVPSGSEVSARPAGSFDALGHLAGGRPGRTAALGSLEPEGLRGRGVSHPPAGAAAGSGTLVATEGAAVAPVAAFAVAGAAAPAPAVSEPPGGSTDAEGSLSPGFEAAFLEPGTSHEEGQEGGMTGDAVRSGSHSVAVGTDGSSAGTTGTTGTQVASSTDSGGSRCASQPQQEAAGASAGPVNHKVVFPRFPARTVHGTSESSGLTLAARPVLPPTHSAVRFRQAAPATAATEAAVAVTILAAPAAGVSSGGGSRSRSRGLRHAGRDSASGAAVRAAEASAPALPAAAAAAAVARPGRAAGVATETAAAAPASATTSAADGAALLTVQAKARASRQLTVRLRKSEDRAGVASLVKEHKKDLDLIHVSAALVALARMYRRDPKSFTCPLTRAAAEKAAAVAARAAVRAAKAAAAGRAAAEAAKAKAAAKAAKAAAEAVKAAAAAATPAAHPASTAGKGLSAERVGSRLRVGRRGKGGEADKAVGKRTRGGRGARRKRRGRKVIARLPGRRFMGGAGVVSTATVVALRLPHIPRGSSAGGVITASAAGETPGGPSSTPSLRGRRRTRPQVLRLVEALLKLLPALMPRADPRTVSNLLWALGVLQPLLVQPQAVASAAASPRQRRQPLRPAIAAAASRLVAKMRHFWLCVRPAALAQALWGMARLGLRPGPLWAAEFEVATVRLLPYFTAHELSYSLWALAEMRLRPESGWVAEARRVLPGTIAADEARRKRAAAAAAAAAESAGAQLPPPSPASGTSNLQQLATVLWACAVLHVRLEPPAAVVLTSALRARLEVEGGGAGHLALSMALWGAARLGLKLPADVMALWRAAAAGPCLAGADAQSLSYMLWAQARAQGLPPGPWVAECTGALLARARESSVGQAAGIRALWALAQLDARVGSEWLWEFAHGALGPVLPGLSAGELALVLHSMVRLDRDGRTGGGGDCDRRATFLSEAAAAAAVAMGAPGLTQGYAASIAESMRLLGAPVGRDFRAALVYCTSEWLRSGRLRPRLGAQALAALAADPDSFAEVFCAATVHDSSPAAGADDGPSTDSSDIDTAVPPPPQSLSPSWPTGSQPPSSPSTPTVTPQRVLPLCRYAVELLRAVVTYDVSPSAVYDVAQAMRATAALGYVPSTPAARRAVAAAVARVLGAETSAHGVLALLQGLHALRIRPPATWLSQAAAHAGFKGLRSMSGEEIEALLRLLCALDASPGVPPVEPSSPAEVSQPQLQQGPAATQVLLAALQPSLASSPIQHLLALAGSLVAATTLPVAPGADGSSGRAAAADAQPTSRTRGDASGDPRLLPPTHPTYAPFNTVVPLEALLPQGWMEHLEEATARKLGQQCVSARALVELLACFACLGHAPGAVWVAHWYECTAGRLRTLAPSHLMTALQLQRRLGYVPPRPWLEACGAALAEAEVAAALPPLEVLAAVAELQRLGLEEATAAVPAVSAATSPPLSSLVAAAATRLQQQLAAAEPAEQVATLAALQALADPRVFPVAPQSEGWTVGVLAMAHSVILQQPLRRLLAGLNPPQQQQQPRPPLDPLHPSGCTPPYSQPDSSQAVGAAAAADASPAPAAPDATASAQTPDASPTLAPASSPDPPPPQPPPSQTVAITRTEPSDPLVFLLASLARWGHQPDCRWMSAVARHLCSRYDVDHDGADAAEQAPAASGSLPPPHDSSFGGAVDTACAVCCLASMGYVPPLDVAERLQRQLLPALTAAALPPKLAAEVCYVWAVVRREPPAAWWRAAEVVALAPPLLSELPPSALVRLPWCMAQLGHVPSYNWLASYLTHVPHALAALLAAVAPSLSPRELRPAGAASATAAILDDCVPLGLGYGSLRGGDSGAAAIAADVANLTWALGTMFHEGGHAAERLLCPGGAVAALLAASRVAMGAMGPGQLVLLVEGLARMRQRLPGSWVAAFAEQSVRQLDVCRPSDVVSFLYCLAILDAKLPPAWLAAVLHCTTQLLPALLVSEEAYRTARQRAAAAAASDVSLRAGGLLPPWMQHSDAGAVWRAAAAGADDAADGNDSCDEASAPAGRGRCRGTVRRRGLRPSSRDTRSGSGSDGEGIGGRNIRRDEGGCDVNRGSSGSSSGSGGGGSEGGAGEGRAAALPVVDPPSAVDGRLVFSAEPPEEESATPTGTVTPVSRRRRALGNGLGGLCRRSTRLLALPA